MHFLAFPECQSGEGPLLESLMRIAEDDFFGAIEVTRINDPSLRRKVAQLFAQSHLKVDFGAHPIILGSRLNLNSLDQHERRNALEVLDTYLERAAELGAHNFVVLSGPDVAEGMREEATGALVESLQRLCEKARKYHLSVVLETFDRAVDKKALFGPSNEAAALAATLRTNFPQFGLLYDMAHGILLDEAPLQALSVLKDYLVHVHVGNCVKVPGRVGYGDLHPRFGYPGGESNIQDLADFVEALFQIEYLKEQPINEKRTIGFEIKPQPGETSEAILANLKRAWSKAWYLVAPRSTFH